MKNKLYLILFAIIGILVLPEILYAAEESVKSNPSMFLEMLKGAMMGLLTVFIGWSKQQEPGKFDWRGLYIRVPTGLIVGLIAGYKGMSFQEAHHFAEGMGVILIIDNVIKMIMRRYPGVKEKTKKGVQRGIDKIKKIKEKK